MRSINPTPFTNFSRTIRFMSSSFPPLRVGIAGLGRSGWSIHATTLRSFPGRYEIVGVTDPDAGRRAECASTLGCTAHDSLESLLRDPEIELVVIATPNPLHPAHATAALEAGKHVVVEKPVAASAAEIDAVIATAATHDRVLAPFQQYRYEAQFQKVCEIVDSGVLGRILQVRICWHGFKRRWDWQTLREFSGGSLNNTGPHVLDHAFAFVPEHVEPEIFCDLQRGLTAGDAEDHVKIILRAPGSPTIDIEISDVVAHPLPRWQVSGTGGGLTGAGGKLSWRWVDWSTLPKRPVDRQPTVDRSYNSETLTWQEDTWQAPPDAPSENEAFYVDLHRTLREGEPLVITPQSVRRRVAAMERCHALGQLR